MIKLLVFLALAVPLLIVACGAGSGGGDNEARTAVASVGIEATAVREVIREVVVEKEVAASRQEAVLAASPPRLPSASDLQVVERKVISTAFISLEVEVVQAATAEVRAIAEGLGGFVEQLSTSGGPERQQANITVRVPQGQFFTALDRLSELGEVRSQNVGSEDVSEEFIDLEARLKSVLREEKSLLSLLGKAEKVSEILTIERELSRVRSEIERLQGRLNFLERRVDLATITVSLFSPGVDAGEPPSASLTIEASDVTRSVERIKGLVKSLDGEIDRVSIFVHDGEESAVMTLRVFIQDFDSALGTIEDMGDVKNKNLEEGTPPRNGDVETPEEPDARINVSLEEKEGGANTGLIIAIAAPVGGTALALLLALLFYVVYRTGHRRGRAV